MTVIGDSAASKLYSSFNNDLAIPFMFKTT